MNINKNKYRFLLAGGGTGGHLFPAVAVADKIKLLKPEAEILFVGTKGKIEASVIPSLGYNFKPIWIKGFSRKNLSDNLILPLRLIVSMLQSLYISIIFKPKVAIGSGGYVSGPAIWGASVMGAKILLIEQNSYPGITTKLLERYASEIYISFTDAQKYFRDKDKLKLTGNPVRESLKLVEKAEALKMFGLNAEKKTILILGGSLGAMMINKIVSENLTYLKSAGFQIIWQTGKNYYDSYKNLKDESVWIGPFIEKMNLAYSACDLAFARAGATTIAELTSMGVASILVPSPNVAENHQYYNAKSISDKNAAVLLEEKNLEKDFKSTIDSLFSDKLRLDEIKTKCRELGKTDAAEIIAKQAINYAEEL